MKTTWSHIRSAFVSGLLLLAPLAVTVWVVMRLIQFLGNPVHEILDGILRYGNIAEWTRGWNIPDWVVELGLELLSALVAVMLITLVGIISERFASKFFWRWMEGFLHRVPLVKSVYGTVKQIVETFSHGNRAVFQQVVMVRYPHAESWTVGFLTGPAAAAIQEQGGDDLVNVFVPTTPNPTSGFLLLVPRDSIRPLNLSVADGMKLIISGGTVSPEKA